MTIAGNAFVSLVYQYWRRLTVSQFGLSPRPLIVLVDPPRRFHTPSGPAGLSKG